MNKDLIFVSSSTQSVAQNCVIALPTILRRKGTAVESIGSGIILRKAGYYEIRGTVTFTTPTAGTASVEIQKDGNTVAGITSSVTTGGTSEVHTLAYTGVIRVYCGEPNVIVSLVNTGVAVAISSATLEADYYA